MNLHIIYKKSEKRISKILLKLDTCSVVCNVSM